MDHSIFFLIILISSSSQNGKGKFNILYKNLIKSDNIIKNCILFVKKSDKISNNKKISNKKINSKENLN